MLQSHALTALFELCRDAGIHTALETCGALPQERFRQIVGLVDCWLFGYRPTPFYVPPGARFIDDNLAFLSGMGKQVIVRTPVVAGITDAPESLERIVSTMHACGLNEIELLPFHIGTSHYYSAVGTACVLDDRAIPSADRMDAVQTYFMQHGIDASVTR